MTARMDFIVFEMSDFAFVSFLLFNVLFIVNRSFEMSCWITFIVCSSFHEMEFCRIDSTYFYYNCFESEVKFM